MGIYGDGLYNQTASGLLCVQKYIMYHRTVSRVGSKYLFLTASAFSYAAGYKQKWKVVFVGCREQLDWCPVFFFKTNVCSWTRPTSHSKTLRTVSYIIYIHACTVSCGIHVEQTLKQALFSFSHISYIHSMHIFSHAKPLWSRLKYLNFYCTMDWHKILYRHSWVPDDESYWRWWSFVFLLRHHEVLLPMSLQLLYGLP